MQTRELQSGFGSWDFMKQVSDFTTLYLSFILSINPNVHRHGNLMGMQMEE